MHETTGKARPGALVRKKFNLCRLSSAATLEQMRRTVVIGCVCFAGCGRLHFDSTGSEPKTTDASSSDGGSVDGSSTDAPTAPDPRLVLYFDFEGGDPLRDKVGNHTTRCETNCPQIVASGPRGSAATFANAAGCIHVTDAPDLRSDTFAYAVWFRPLAAVNQTALSRPYESETGIRNTFELAMDRDADLAKILVSTFVYTSRHPRSLTLGVWHHAAGSYDGQTVRVYYDGVLVFASLSPALPLPLTPNEPLIGCDRDRAVDYAFFRGEIDDVRVYSAALSDAEVAALAAP